MKKIAISLLFVPIAIFAFLYIQLQQAKTRLSEQFEQRGIAVKSLDLSLIPQPTLTIEQVNYRSISLKHINAQLAFLPLIYGEAKLQQLSIEQAKSGEDALNSARIEMRFSDFLVKNLLSKNILFNGSNVVSIKLEKPIYGLAQKFNFTFNKAGIRLRQNAESLIQFDGATLNQQPLGYIEIHADLAKPQKAAAAYIKPDCTTACLAVLKFNTLAEESAVNFSGKNFPLTQLLTLLNFPDTITGTADFNIQLAFEKANLTKSKFDFYARDGELLGINLLQLVSQYFPINYNDELLEGKRANTPYQQVEASFSLDKSLLNIDKFNLKTTVLLGEGQGAVDLHTMQCDITLSLSATNPKYKNLTLPIRFFDSCYSPQYKLEINKDFRKQLKNIIKEKLK
ncbi:MULTISPECIES: AsmA-like C-terminal region-containing protein [Rodentibacter]|uniref:AsmA-like C-terminal region-containing protein n=1 Tax=Rodentibacter TaxID=1960084 RepID=UPI001CFEF541|nr:AsmA-like C-terminal region-containing protein [Rodentibacter sp. JRC1]GJI56627.1 hypothetical protein HEMROJRC1_17390 [Rodentibacter sp. JRC1]